MFEQMLCDYKSVIVDMSMPQISDRKKYIDIARIFYIPVVVIWLDISRYLAIHLNHMKTELTGIMPVPLSEYYKFNTLFNPPTYDEHVYNIIKMPFILSIDPRLQAAFYREYAN